MGNGSNLKKSESFSMSNETKTRLIINHNQEQSERISKGIVEDYSKSRHVEKLINEAIKMREHGPNGDLLHAACDPETIKELKDIHSKQDTDNPFPIWIGEFIKISLERHKNSLFPV